MKWLKYSVLVVLLFWVMRHFFLEGHEVYFQAFRIFMYAYVVFSLGTLLTKVARKDGGQMAFRKFLEERLGTTFFSYLIYEIEMIKGIAYFLIAPLANYRKIAASYFVNSYLHGAIFVLLFLVIGESCFIHILISTKSSESVKLALQITFVLSELIVIEMIIGNLYYLQISKVEISEEKILVRMGLLWELDCPINMIKNIDYPIVTVRDEKVPRIALFQEPQVRIHFREKITARKLFKQKKLSCVDIFLKEKEVRELLSVWQMNFQKEA